MRPAAHTKKNVLAQVPPSPRREPLFFCSKQTVIHCSSQIEKHVDKQSFVRVAGK